MTWKYFYTNLSLVLYKQIKNLKNSKSYLMKKAQWSLG